MGGFNGSLKDWRATDAGCPEHQQVQHGALLVLGCLDASIGGGATPNSWVLSNSGRG